MRSSASSLLASVLTATVVSAAFWVFGGISSPDPTRNAAIPLSPADDDGALKRRIDDLERLVRSASLESAARNVQVRRESLPEPLLRPDEQANAEILDEDLETRFQVLETQVEALMRDPMERGYAFLSSASPELRRQGIELLERFAHVDPRARAAIRGMLTDASPEVREEALDAIEDLRDGEALPQVRALLADANAQVREEAIDALRSLMRDAEPGSAEAREVSLALQARLGDMDAEVREEAIDALADLELDSAEPLLASLNDPSAEVREEAIQALGRTGDPQAIPRLREMYESGDPSHRLDAALAMARLGDRSAFREQAPRWVETVSDPGASSRDRSRALWILGRGDPATYQNLLEQASQDPNDRVRRTAERILRRMRDR